MNRRRFGPAIRYFLSESSLFWWRGIDVHQPGNLSLLPLDLNRSVPPRRETFTVRTSFHGPRGFGQPVLCKTNTRLLGWSVAWGLGDEGGEKRYVVEGVGDITCAESVIASGVGLFFP